MMSVLLTLLLIVEVLTAFLLVVVILAQKSKDQGLGMAFGGGIGESLFGSRTGNVLTKMTITLMIIFMVDTLVIGILFAHGQGRGGRSLGEELAATELEAAVPVAEPATEAVPVEGIDTAALPEATAEGADITIPAAPESAPQAFVVTEDGQLVPQATDPEAPAVEEPAAEPAPEPVEAPAEAVEAVEEAVEAPAAEEIAENAPEAAPEAAEAVEKAGKKAKKTVKKAKKTSKKAKKAAEEAAEAVAGEAADAAEAVQEAAEAAGE